MATILVDYENVSTNDGLKGVEYLNENAKSFIYGFDARIWTRRRQSDISGVEAGGVRKRYVLKLSV